MKVNIIAPDYKSDWIIARLARHLIERNGWTGSFPPDPRAAVNVFMPYCQWRHTRWDKTLTAAWFTHKEDALVENGAKLRRWEFTAPALDLRVTPAALYVPELSAYGATVQIPHPVDKQFFPRPMKHHKRRVIGVSGRVYGGGRKGEHLVARFAKENRHYDVRASGIGWPVPTRRYRWWDMPGYYHGLDVFLCTSLVEGGPVTVLEALACGRPVVIPRGVGQMDELPEGPGVRHYERGEYRDMERAIIAALRDQPIDPEVLRALVTSFTPKRYAEEWQTAIQHLVEASA